MDAVSDVSQAQVVTIPMIVTTIIAVILTLLRLYVRIRMIKLFGWDDFFNVLAMVRNPSSGVLLVGTAKIFQQLLTGPCVFAGNARSGDGPHPWSGPLWPGTTLPVSGSSSSSTKCQTVAHLRVCVDCLDRLRQDLYQLVLETIIVRASHYALS
jgi:hypothetical protein